MSIKIDAFPDASTNMSGSDRVTGLQGGINVNFSQSQLGFLNVSVSLSSAQIKALNSSPITLLAGVSGKTIIPVVAFIAYHFVSVDFVGSAGIFYNATGTLSDIVIDGDTQVFSLPIAEGNGSSFRIMPPLGRSYVTGAVSQNKPLVFYAEDGDPTTGDGSLDITVWYFLY